jgi:putative flippase GtrA
MSVSRPKRLGEEGGAIDGENMSPVLLRRAMRFALTGIVVTGVHFVIAITFIELIMPTPPLANGVAFAFATVASYLINTIWSFSGRLHGRTLSRFIAVSIVGFLLAMLVSWIVQELGFGYLLGICAVALTIPPMTFILHNFWTYR